MSTHFVGSPHAFSAYFQSLLEQHVARLTIRHTKARGLCPVHTENTPSFTADIEKGVFYCFGCGAGGGVKKFAQLVGAPWAVASLTPREQAHAAVARRRRDAERQVRAILQAREAQRLDRIFTEWRAVNCDVAHTAELLVLFRRHPDLEIEFAEVAAQVERAHGAAVSRRVLLEARMDREIAE